MSMSGMGAMGGMGGMASSTAASSTMPMATMTGDQTVDGRMPMNHMMMTFFVSTTTSLFGEDFTPETVGEYAAACVFLIVLSLLLRALYAYKSLVEARWLYQARKRRYIRVATETTPGAKEEPKQGLEKSPTATLTANGVTETVKLVETDKLICGSTWRRPWRLSVDLPRALLVTLMVGVGYLLMLAVMTMNVGYFMSVLAGAFVGELYFGRYSQHVEDHH